MTNIDDIIENFNEGDVSIVEDMFDNDYQLFFEFLDQRGELDKIEFNTDYSSTWDNEFAIYLSKYHKDKFYEYCNSQLSDIEFENGKIYCVAPNASDFGVLFCDNRDVSRGTIEAILDGEADFDWYYWSSCGDIYNYVIKELNDKNLNTLKQRFIKELTGVEVPTETKLLEEIAEEQEHIDYVIIDSNNINTIFDNKKTVEFLLEDVLDSEIKNELIKIYSDSNQSAFESEYYESVWGELTSEYFTGKPEWITRKHRVATKDVHMVRLEINDFDDIIIGYLNDNSGYGNSGTLEYQGSYLEVLRNLVDCLSVRFPEYASYPEKYINDYFVDYF